MRLIQYKPWLQCRCLRTSSIHCRGFKRLKSCIFANVIITLSNLLHCNHGKLYWHRLSSKFSPGSCGARCGLRNADWCWLLGTWGASNQNFIWSHSHSLRWHGGGGAATTEWPGEQRNKQTENGNRKLYLLIRMRHPPVHYSKGRIMLRTNKRFSEHICHKD